MGSTVILHFAKISNTEQPARVDTLLSVLLTSETSLDILSQLITPPSSPNSSSLLSVGCSFLDLVDSILQPKQPTLEGGVKMWELDFKRSVCFFQCYWERSKYVQKHADVAWNDIGYL